MDDKFPTSFGDRFLATWKRAFADKEKPVSLEDLRNQVLVRLVFLFIGVSFLLIWGSMTIEPFPLIEAGYLGSVLVLAVIVGQLSNRHPIVAKHLLVWGLTMELLAAMWVFPDPWLPFLGVFLILISAILITGSEFVTAGLVYVMSVVFTNTLDRTYSLGHLMAFLSLGVAITFLFIRALFTALEWMRNMQQRADKLLDEVRVHRGELSRAIKNLESANLLLRRKERELLAARNQAVKERRLKEQFAANISHELRTPLNLILGFSDMMYLSPEVYGDINWPLTLRRDVHQIYRSSRHLLAMIDDVLDLSRFEMVGFALNKEPTNMNFMLTETTNIAENLFKGASVKFETEIAPNLPPLDIDRTRITQVLLNLLNNAKRFTTAGKVSLEVRYVNDEIIFSISDTGPGIPQENLSQIFDEFYQVDQSLRRTHQGAGLGLAISKRFVEAHGGRIWVESIEGEGSTFFFSLPTAMFASDFGIGDDTRYDEDVSIEYPDILVIDRDPAVVAQFQRRFDKYKIHQVKSVNDLTKTVETHHPRAVIYNVSPDDYSPGDDVVASIPVPLIECSLPSSSWMVKHLQVVACLTKPFKAEQLQNEIALLEDIHKVLVIDDDRGFTQLVTRIMETGEQSFDLRQAYSGETGLQMMFEQIPDLVLLDLAMPGVDGFKVLQEMKKDPTLKNVPVILLTATSYIEDVMAQYSNQMVIRRSDRLNINDVLSCIHAVINVLEPHYEEYPAA